MRAASWSSVLSFAANDCLTERTQAAITQPEVVRDFLCPVSSGVKDSIRRHRSELSTLTSRPVSDHGAARELVVIAGPQFITNATQSRACAQWIRAKNSYNTSSTVLNDKLKSLYSPVSNVKVVMNANVSHVKALDSRCTSRARSSGSDHHSSIHGPQGAPVVQPYFLTGGLVNTRMHLLELCQVGAPLVGHVDDPIAQVYFKDLFSMALVPRMGGRALVDVVSDLEYPIGFHTTGNELKDVQKDYLNGAKCSRSHLTVMNLGQVGVVSSKGNEDTFIVINLKEVINNMDELIASIDRELVYGVKILFDVGKVSGVNNKTRLESIKAVLTSVLRPRMLGFIVDSGDNYIMPDQHMLKEPHDDFAGDENELPVEYNAISEELGTSPKKSSMGNFMKKSFLSSYSKLSNLSFRQKDNNSALENWIYADKLIREIDKLSSSL